jgi:SM-20-related protein
VIVDGAFAPDFIRALFQRATDRLQYSFARLNRADQTAFPSLSAQLRLTDVKSDPLWSRLAKRATSAMAWKPQGKAPRLVRGQVNVTTLGDVQFVHADVGVSVTAVYFANPEWHVDWLGELLFYDAAESEVVAAVTPKPGRMVVFESSARHRAGIPSVLCRIPRVTVALKFKL